MKAFYILLIISALLVSSCKTGYQKVMKSGSVEERYDAAIAYYEAEDYYRALQLFEGLMNFYKGTEKAENLQYYYAYCHYKQNDYILASYYFKRFAQFFPRSPNAEEAMFLSAYCYYLDSPKTSLDQSNTVTAITELELFMTMYPNSSHYEEAGELIDKCWLKLEQKEFNIAKLYYKMGRYEAAIASLKNLMKDFPMTDYKEEILYYIFKSHYSYAHHSIRAKQRERYQEAVDSYNEFVFQYPESSHMKDVNNMHNTIQKKLRK